VKLLAAGLVCTVMCTEFWVKAAVSVTGAFIVIEAGLFVPE
jgi:hypothetical protein